MSDIDECEDWSQPAFIKPSVPEVVTTKQIQEAIDRVHGLAVQKAEIENELSNVNKLIMSAENLVIALLEKAGMTEFPSEYGKFSIGEKSTLSMKTVNKAEFYDYLKKTGQFDALATIHARTFIGWYNKEEQRAREEGREMEFSIPGVPAPTTYTTLTYKKPKAEGASK